VFRVILVYLVASVLLGLLDWLDFRAIPDRLAQLVTPDLLALKAKLEIPDVVARLVIRVSFFSDFYIECHFWNI